MRSASLLGISVLCLGLAAGSPVAAQEPGGSEAPAGPAPSAEPPPPEVVPVAEVASRSEAMRRSLRDQLAQLRSDETVDGVAEAIPRLTETLARDAARARQRLASGPELFHLNEIEAEWRFRRRRLDEWTAVLTSRAEALQEILDDLGQRRELWQRSLAAARQEGAPAETAAAMRENLQRLAEATDEAKGRRDRVLRLQSDLAEYEAAVSDVLASVELARSEARDHIFQTDAPPVWRAPAESAATDSTWERLQRSMRDEINELSRFLGAARGILPVILAVYLAVAAGAHWLRRRLRARAGSERLEGPAQVFDRPFSVAALVALALTLGSLPFVPLLARQVLGVVIILPAFRLIAPVVPSSVHPLLWALFGFFLVDRVRQLLIAAPLLERAMFLAETLAAAALIAFLLRPSRLAKIPADARPPELLGYGMRLALGLFAASTVANVLGAMSLARVLGQGTLVAIYAGLIAFALYRLATTSILLLLSSGHAQRLAFVRRGGPTLMRWSRGILALVLLASWSVTAFQSFLVWDPVRSALVSVFTTPVEIGNVAIALRHLATFGLIIFAGWVLSRAIRFVLQEDVTPRMDLGRGVGNAISTVAGYVVLVGGFLLAVAAAGLDLSSLALIVGALSVGIGIGLQDVVNNFVSGLILLFERPVQVGDVVQVGTLSGNMTRIGIRSSTLLTFDGSEVILPNARLVSDQVVNWTLSNARRRIDVPVGVAYGSDHAKVLRVLDEATRSVPTVLRDPAPMVLFSGFGDSSLDFEVRFWVMSESFLSARSGVVSAIYEGLGRDRVEIPFPQRDLHLRSLDAGVLRALGRGAGDRAPDAPREAGDASPEVAPEAPKSPPREPVV